MNTGQSGVEVIQSDRDQAAAHCLPRNRASNMRAGLMDGDSLVQAFARYRQSLTAREPATADVGRKARARAALAVACDFAGLRASAGHLRAGGWPVVSSEPAIRAMLAFADDEAALSRAAPSSDDARTIEILRRALAWHSDPQRMATTREEWQQTIDDAIVWVKANPEADRPYTAPVVDAYHTKGSRK